MDFQVNVGGNSYTNYVVSFDRTHDICQGTGTCEMVLSSDLPYSPIPFDSIGIYEYGEKVFSGYVDMIDRSLETASVKVSGTDVLKRARDFFIADPIYSYQETITYWIEYFLNLCGLTSHNVASTTDTVPPDLEFNKEHVMDIIKKLCSTQGWTYFADGSGTIQVGDLMEIGSPVLGIAEGRNLASIIRHYNDSWLRNRVVVWGYGDAKGVATDAGNPYFQSGEVRTAAIHLLSLGTTASAQAFAEELLEEFSDPLDLKTLEVVLVSGDANPQIGDTVAVREAFTSINTLCLVTALTSTMSSEGAELTLYLDARCPSYWGWGPVEDYTPTEPGGIIWLSTEGSGVWRYSGELLGGIWVDVSGDLSGNALYVREIELDEDDSSNAWIATLDGVYKFELGVWTKQTLPDPVNDAGDDPAPTTSNLDFVSIDVLSGQYVVVTARHTSLNRGWIYILDGGIWNSWQILN